MSPARVTSRSIHHRTASAPNWAATSAGSSAFPSDLLIFCPPAVKYSCTKIVVGSFTPADSSIAGQYTAWNRMMPFPITWTRSSLVFHQWSNVSASVP